MAKGRGKKADKTATEKPKRLARIRETFTMARQVDPQIGWISLAVFLVSFAVIIGVAALLGQTAAGVVVGIPLAVLVTTFIFGRRVEGASYRFVEGKPGAAAGVLETIRRGWTVTPAVAVTREQDFVHRAVGRPGVVLVGEGNHGRVTRLLAQERKRHARVALDVPVHEVVVGDGTGEVPLRKLTKHLRKLEKKITPSQVTEVISRLRALRTQPVPVPKGPMPRSTRMPRGGVNPR